MMAAANTCLRGIDHAASALCVVVAVALIAVLAGSFADSFSGYSLLVERSDSMQPALRSGDLLVAKRVPATSISRGDIVTFADVPRGGRLVTHRVVAIRRNGPRIVFTTRGDANPVTESHATSSAATVQRLSAGVPVLGRVLALLATVALPALLICMLVLVPALLRRSGRAWT